MDFKNDYLIHYGVRGMRWGVRRAERRAAIDAANKKLSEMSDAELQRRLTRLNMEKQYRQHMAELNPQRKSKVMEWAVGALSYGMKTISKKAFDNMVENLFKKDKGDRPLSFTDKELKDLGPTEAATLSKYAENLSKIQKYMAGKEVPSSNN